MDLSAKKIGIWGFGKEGESLYRYLSAYDDFKELIVLLDNPSAEVFENIPVLSGDKATQAIQSGHFDLIFKSPGISLYKPEIKQARGNGTQFSSATNLWFAHNNKTKKIVVTGTKGKSTTASLLFYVMDKLGFSVSLAGNIGVPLLDLEGETDYTVIELSSYQLADLKYSPEIFVILNLFPEHLQWHLTHENYYKDKLQILKTAQDSQLVANAQNKILKNYISRTQENHDVLWFNKDDEDIAHIKTQLKGVHNQDNIQAVLTVCEALGVDSLEARAYIERFNPLLHRLQEFTSAEGVLCVNDSISTTPESAIAAMSVYRDHPQIVILGGTDRGQDYATLIDYMKGIDIKAVLLLPKNGDRLEIELKQSGFNKPVLPFKNLTKAVKWIKTKAEKGDVVLLSPAAPSYDQFKNFEERGDLFIKLMRE